MRFIVLFALVFFYGFVAFPQEYSIIDRKAIRLYKEGESLMAKKKYDEAIEKFNAAIRRERNFVEPYIRLTRLHLDLGNPDLAEQSAMQGKSRLGSKEALPQNIARLGWELTRLYLKKGEFQKACDQFLEVNPLLDSSFKTYAKYKEMKVRMDFLKEQLDRVRPVDKKILESPLNRFRLQYFPVLTADGRRILFTKRDGTSNYDNEDIYMASLTSENSWTSPESVSKMINSSYNEGTCSVTADGNILIYTSCDAPDSHGSCDLYIAYKVGGSWQRPTNMGEKVNSRFWDSQPSLSADGRLLFFSSNRRGGHGGNDIWYSVRQGDGSWSEAKNLGQPINTPKNEISPFMFFNNDILFFASEGHQGFGGMDIFLSRVKEGKFQRPENLGLPINDHLDQVALFITADKAYAYYTELSTGVGEEEDSALLYRFHFPKEIYLGENLTVTEGHVFNARTGLPIEATLSLVSLDNDSTLYEFPADGKTGKFVMLYPDKTVSGLYVSKQGYLPKIFNVDRDKIQNVEDLKVELVPIAPGEEFVFENVFFDFDRYDLQPKSLPSLRRLRKFLADNPGVNILIIGHTDNVGNNQYNRNLSLQRAKSVQDFLVEMGIHSERTRVEGKGDKEPMVPNSTPQNQALNRRISIKVL